MSKDTLVIIYLSIVLGVTQFAWVRAEKKAAYLQGKEDLYIELTKMSPDSEPYISHKKGN